MPTRPPSVILVLVISLSLAACVGLQQTPSLSSEQEAATQLAAQDMASETAAVLAATAAPAASSSATIQPSPTIRAALTPSPATANPSAATTTPNGPQKQDFENSLAWTKVFGSAFTDEINDIAGDDQGNVYVACVCGLVTNSSGGFVGQALLKFSGAGELLWQRPQDAGSGGLFDQALATTSAGAVVMIGNAASDYELSYVVVYDSDGTQIWKNDLRAHLSSVAADEAGNVYVTFQTGKYDVFVIKYGSAGQQLWTQLLSSGQINGLTAKLVGGPHGQVYLVGSLSGALPGQTSLGKDDVFTILYDSAGQATRVQQFGSPEADYILDAAVDEAGNLYVAYVNSQIVLAKYDPSGNQVWSQSLAVDTDITPQVSLAPDQDHGLYVLLIPDWPYSLEFAEVRKLDSAGTNVWSRSFPAAWPGMPDNLARDGTGSLYLAGSTDSPLPGSTEEFGAGDVFLLKMNP